MPYFDLNMHLSWLGNTAVKIQTKPFDQDVVIVIDTYKPDTGNFPRNLSAHIALYTEGEKDSITISGNPFVLSSPGECETKDVLISAVQGSKKDQIMFRIDAEDISIGHLGFAEKQLTNEQLKVLSGVDILFVPVGGKDCYDAEAAAKAINSVEPRIVIPTNYQSDNSPKSAKVEDFLKEIGATGTEAEKKIIIKKKDLPQEETKVMVLEKE
jgi:L-ascorbate metabolism protein UlaG (beta-lactamase superfamily)